MNILWRFSAKEYYERQINLEVSLEKLARQEFR